MVTVEFNLKINPKKFGFMRIKGNRIVIKEELLEYKEI